MPKSEPKLVETRQFKYFNSSCIPTRPRMAFHNDYNSYNFSNPNHAWEVWKTIFLDIANLHAPLRLRRVKSEHGPWITNNIKNLAYHKYNLKQKAIKFNSSNYQERSL
jgi:hypothetical protein